MTGASVQEILFCPTLRCNLRCAHCCVNLVNKAPDELTLPEIEKIFASKLAAGADVLISGGEPFMRDDVVDILEAVLSRTGRLVKVLTNGTYHSRLRQAAERLHAYKDRLRFSISVDGKKEAHDAIRGIDKGYDLALGAIRLLKESGYDVHACCIVQKGNVDHVTTLSEELGREGIHVSLSPLMEFGEEHVFEASYAGHERTLWSALNATPANYSYVLTRGRVRIRDCHAGLTNLYISPYGDVYECFVRLDIAGQAKGRIGRLRELSCDLDRLYAGFRPEARDSRNCEGCCNESELIREGLYHNVLLPFVPDAYEALVGPLPSRIECGDRSGDGLLLTGWSYGEGSHRWSHQRAEVHLRAAGPNLRYRVLCSHPDLATRPVFLRVSVNGQLVAEQRFDANDYGTFCRAEIDVARWLREGEANELRFEVDRTWTEPSGFVRRPFGLAFDWIALEP